MHLQLQLRYHTEAEKFKKSIVCDKFSLELNQLRKALKEVENDEDKCDYYDILSKIEDVTADKIKSSRVKTKLLESNPANQFKNHGKYNLETLLWYLWDNTDIQAEFVHNYIIPKCNENPNSGITDAANELLGLVVHQLFLEPTS